MEESYKEIIKLRDDIDVFIRVVEKELESKNEIVFKWSWSVLVFFILD